jgi:hypothetical protein
MMAIQCPLGGASPNGVEMDVTAMKVKIPEDRDLLYLPWESGAPNVTYSDLKLWISQKVSIVGYPYGLNNNKPMTRNASRPRSCRNTQPIALNGGQIQDPQHSKAR